MGRLPAVIEHLLRRAGFGLSSDERESYDGLEYFDVVDKLLNFDPATTDIDDKIGTPGYVGITTSGRFSPNLVVNDARQRWLFRMVHTPAPLQERMALIWHNHFATAFSKISGIVGSTDATRMMAAKPSEDAGGARGQIELFRQYALGNFRDLLIEVAKDPAMLVWLDGRTNKKGTPQENFGRELMELFTFGVANYVETDVYAAARVFTGWNLAPVGVSGMASAYYAFNYDAGNHDTGAKDFSFPIYADGSKRIPARSASAGMQDGIDLITALAFHPETAKRLASLLWVWFVNEISPPDPSFVSTVSGIYLNTRGDMKATIRAVLVSPQFMDPSSLYERYSWPAEFVIRLLKEVGYLGFSVNNAITPMLNMGQQLYEPPDVSGWDLGPEWFSTGGMLARMNFARDVVFNSKVALRDAARSARATPETLISFVLGRLTLQTVPDDVNSTLIDYVRAGGAWVGSETQLLNKTGGLFHLLTGSGQYQFV